MMRSFVRRESHSIRLLEDFVSAGTSALLLSVAHLQPGLWWVLLFALVPFLWRVIKATPNRSILLGAIAACCYYSLAFPDELLFAPVTFALKLFGLNLVFASYAILVNRTSRYLGINAIFIAAFWLPLEYGLIHLTGLQDIFSFSASESGILLRIGSLFGLLMVSFVVVLVNTLSLIILVCFVQALRSCEKSSARDDMQRRGRLEEIIVKKGWYLLPIPRGPPLTTARLA